MNTLIASMNSWNLKSHTGVTEDEKENLKNLLVDLKSYQESRDLSLLERITLLIDECIILDMVNDDMVEHQGQDFARIEIIAQIEKLFNVLLSSSMIGELNEITVIAAKENLAYRIALLFQKIHRYRKAYKYFQKSREFSTFLSVPNSEYGLSEIERIERDIHFAFCCEYIGTGDSNNDKGKLIIALKVLLGENNQLGSDNYWKCLKQFCSGNWNEIEKIICQDNNEEEKGSQLISLILKFGTEKGVLHRICEKKHEYGSQYREAVHVLSHCLNEINLISPSGSITSKEEETEELRNTRTIKLISCFLMDSLGPEFATCQATIRAEQGNGIDAISRMQNMDTSKLEEVNQAELDFYLFYFESLFSHTLDTEDSKSIYHGDKFLEYCEGLVKNDPKGFSEEGRDGILHYSVFALRNELFNLLKTLKLSGDINGTFLSDDYKIEKTPCLKHYVAIREKEFSIYVNAQMVTEREKLIAIYNILRIMQLLQVPLVFDRSGEFNEQIQLDSKVEELFIFCRQFNCLNSNNRKPRDKTTDLEGVDTITIDGLLFDIHGDSTILTKFLDTKLIEYSIEQGTSYKKTPSLPKYKMVLYNEDDSEKVSECIQEIYDEMTDGNLQYQVYYIGAADYENYAGNPIIALQNIDLCFTLAYIYATVERVITQILNPKPIYVLAPLRNTTTYSFQEADSYTFIINPAKIRRSAITILRGGIGIGYKIDGRITKECVYDVQFYDNRVKNACIEIIKFEDDRLYVLRDNGKKLVRKNVHTEFLKNMFKEYATARKTVQSRRHDKEICKIIAKEECKTSKCIYFFSKIDNVDGVGTLSVKGHNAGSKFLQFIRLACEEDVVRGANLYLLENSYAVDNNPNHFFICVFNENIQEHYRDICLGNLVTITKIDSFQNMKVATEAKRESEEISGTAEKDPQKDLIDDIQDAAEKDPRKDLIDDIQESIEELKRLLNFTAFNITKNEINEYVKKYENLQKECRENRDRNIEEFRSEYTDLNLEIKERQLTRN